MATVMRYQFNEPLSTAKVTDVRSWFEQFEVFLEVGELVEDPTIPEIPEDENRVQDETDRLTREREVRIEELKELQTTKLLIVNMDSSMFKKATNLCKPTKLVEERYSKLKQRLCEHFAPKPTKFASRYHFTQIRQKENEKSTSYMERLLVCATDCEFQDLDSRLLDQFVAGLREEREKAKLLKKTNLTLEIAREHMLSLEKTKLEAQEMNASSSGTVNSVKYRKKERSHRTDKKTVVTCKKCTLKGHSEKQCFTKCHACKKVGHIRKNCQHVKRKKKRKKDVKTYHVESCSDSESSEESNSELVVKTRIEPPLRALRQFIKYNNQ